MKITPLSLEGLIHIELDVFPDDRGFFVERFNEKKFSDLGLATQFVQDNHSLSQPGVLRGLHMQTNPHQGKLVGCLTGKIWDVAVDLRKNSPTYLKFESVEIDSKSPSLLWIPHGFAHGFCVLESEPAHVLYKVDSLYNKEGEIGIHWRDPQIHISWPVNNPILSQRDESLPTLDKIDDRLDQF